MPLTFSQDWELSEASITTPEPTYGSGGPRPLNGGSELQQCALARINYAGDGDYIFMHSDNYIFHTADVSLIHSR